MLLYNGLPTFVFPVSFISCSRNYLNNPRPLSFSFSALCLLFTPPLCNAHPQPTTSYIAFSLYLSIYIFSSLPAVLISKAFSSIPHTKTNTVFLEAPLLSFSSLDYCTVCTLSASIIGCVFYI